MADSTGLGAWYGDLLGQFVRGPDGTIIARPRDYGTTPTVEGLYAGIYPLSTQQAAQQAEAQMQQRQSQPAPSQIVVPTTGETRVASAAKAEPPDDPWAGMRSTYKSEDDPQSLLDLLLSMFGGSSDKDGLKGWFGGAESSAPQATPIASAAPKSGPQIWTDNFGWQTVGDRLNGSSRGYTITSDPWFNAIRGL